MYWKLAYFCTKTFFVVYTPYTTYFKVAQIPSQLFYTTNYASFLYIFSLSSNYANKFFRQYIMSAKLCNIVCKMQLAPSTYLYGPSQIYLTCTNLRQIRILHILQIPTKSRNTTYFFLFTAEYFIQIFTKPIHSYISKKFIDRNQQIQKFDPSEASKINDNTMHTASNDYFCTNFTHFISYKTSVQYYSRFYRRASLSTDYFKNF